MPRGKKNGAATEVAGDQERPGLQPDRDFTETDEADAELLVEAQSLAVETLTGDIRTFILDRLKHEQSKRPWHERSETDQRDTVQQVEAAVREAMTKAVELIAGHGRRTIKATLDKVVVKDGITATLVMSKFDAQRHALFDSTGQSVLVVVADPEEFTGEREPVTIKPDQGDLVEQVGAVHSAAEDNHADAPFH